MNIALLQYNTDKLLFTLALSLLVALFSLYIYFVSASVVHVVMRQEAEHDIAGLHSEISRLEAEYILAQHDVSDDIATLSGYVASDDKIFIHRADPTLVLSTNEVQ